MTTDRPGQPACEIFSVEC